MVQNAVVKRVVKDGVVEVSLLRQMECGLHCDGACEGCGQKPKEEILATAINAVGAQVGDFVEVEPTSGHNLGIPVIVFLFPCVAMALGYLLGQSVFHLSEVAAIGTAALGLAIGFIPAFLMNRSIQNSGAPEFRVLKIRR